MHQKISNPAPVPGTTLVPHPHRWGGVALWQSGSNVAARVWMITIDLETQRGRHTPATSSLPRRQFSRAGRLQ
jgi:hypothetical protein